MEQAKFIETVEGIKNKAIAQNKKISVDDIALELEKADIQLDEAQLKMVYAFLKTERIDIIDQEQMSVVLEDDGEECSWNQNEDGSADEFSNNETAVLAMYQEEVSGVCVLNDTQILECMNILADDTVENSVCKNTHDKLIHTFLKDVIRWVSNYQDGVVPMGDLIQEGNMTLMEAIFSFDYKKALESSNPTRKLKDYLKKAVISGAQGQIFEQESSNNVGMKIAGRVNAVNECAKSFYEEYGRKATVLEVADRMDMTEEEIKEIVDFSANKMEYIV